MNMYKTTKKGNRVFKLWAACLAVFLSISLVVTLNPIGKNAKAYAQSGSSTNETSIVAQDDQSDDSDDEFVEDNEVVTADEAGYDSNDYELDDEEYSLTDDDFDDDDYDLDNYSLLSENSSDLDDDDYSYDDEDYSYLDDDDTSTSLDDDDEYISEYQEKIQNVLGDVDFENMTDDEFCEYLESLDQDTLDALELTKDDIDSFSSLYKSVSADDTSTEVKYTYKDQYSQSAGDNTSQLEDFKIVRALYKFHLNEDKTGVIIDGIQKIDPFDDEEVPGNSDDTEEEKKEEKEKEKAKIPTLLIPSNITYNPKAVLQSAIEESGEDITLEDIDGLFDLGDSKYFKDEEEEETTEDINKTYPVLGISENAFKDCNDFEQVIFAETNAAERAFYEYLSIGNNAFEGCINVKRIVSNRDVTLGSEAFKDCNKLEYTYFNKNVNSIEDKVFSGCSSLKSVAWDNATINDYTGAEEYLGLGDWFYTAGQYLFEGCDSLEAVCLPDSIKFVSDNAFAGCDNLNTAVIPFSCQHLGNTIFGENKFNDDNTNKLEKIVVLSVDTTFNNGNHDTDQQTFKGLVNKGQQTKSKIFAINGSSFMNEANAAGLPVTYDEKVIVDATNLYDLSHREEEEKQAEPVEGDTRTHHQVSSGHGTGTKDDPFVIRTVSDLKFFGSVVNSGMYDACAVLAADICFPLDADGNPTNDNNWKCIGKDKPWTGTLDGNGFSINGVTQHETYYSNWGTLAELGIVLGGNVALGVACFKYCEHLKKTLNAVQAVSKIKNANIFFFIADAALNVALVLAGKYLREYASRHANYKAGFIHKASGNFEVKDLTLQLDTKSASKELGGLISIVDGNGEISNTTVCGEVTTTNLRQDTAFAGVAGIVNKGSNLRISNTVNACNLNSSCMRKKVSGGMIGKCDAPVNISSSSNTGIPCANGASKNEWMDFGIDLCWCAVFEVAAGIGYFRSSAKLITEIKWNDIVSKNGHSPFYDEFRNAIINSETSNDAKLWRDVINSASDKDKKLARDLWKLCAMPEDHSDLKRTSIIFREFVENKQNGESWINGVKDRISASDIPNNETKHELDRYLKDNFREELQTDVWNPVENEMKGIENSLHEKLGRDGCENIEKLDEANSKIINDSCFQLKSVKECTDKTGKPVNINIGHQNELKKSLSRNGNGMIIKEWDKGNVYYGNNKCYEILEMCITKEGNEKNIVLKFGKKELKFTPENFSKSKGLICSNIDNALRKYKFLEKYIDPDNFYKISESIYDNYLDALKVYDRFFNEDVITNSIKYVNETLPLYKAAGSSFVTKFNTFIDKVLVDSYADYSVFIKIVQALSARNMTPRMLAFMRSLMCWPQSLRSVIRAGYWGAKNKSIINNKRKANTHDSQVQQLNTISDSNLTNNSAVSQADYSEADYGYKKVTGWSSNNNNSSSSTDVSAANYSSSLSSFCDTITKDEIEENPLISQIATRSSILQTVDADFYYSQLYNLYSDIREENYQFEEKYGWDPGTYYSCAGGLVGEACSDTSVITFNDCAIAANCFAGENVGGAIGNCSKGTFNFENCIVNPAATISSLDTTSIKTAAHDPSCGGLIGHSKDCKINMFGCTSGGTTMSHLKSGSFFGNVDSGSVVNINASVSSGFSYTSQDDGYSAGYFAKVHPNSSITISNSYCDGVVAGDMCNKGYFCATPNANIRYNNCYYYSNTDIFDTNKYASSYTAGAAQNSNVDGITCYTDIDAFQSGELCYKLNEGIGEGVFGQNFGWYPYKEKTKQANGEEKEEIKWEYTERYERCVPFYAMRVFKYTEQNSNSGTSAEAQETNTSEVNADGDYAFINTADTADSVSAQEDNNYYSNVPLNCLQQGDIYFVDVKCDEGVMSKPQGRMPIKSGKSHDFQFISKANHTIAQVLYDKIDVTKQLKYDEDSGIYTFTTPDISANHELEVKTKEHIYEEAPIIENGVLYIYNLANLHWLYKHQNNDHGELKDVKCVSLMDNLDLGNYKTLTGFSWKGLGTQEKPFNFEFDGNGFVIKNITDNPLFKNSSNANIHDLTLANVQNSNAGLIDTSVGDAIIKNVRIDGIDHCEAAFIHLSDNVSFSGCFVEDCSSFSYDNNSPVGGLIATASKNSNIIVHESNIAMAANYSKQNSPCGGVVGVLDDGASFEMYNSEVDVNISQNYSSSGDYGSNVESTVGGVIGYTNTGTDPANSFASTHLIKLDNCKIGGSLDNASPVAVGVAFMCPKDSSYVKSCYFNFSKINAVKGTDKTKFTSCSSWSALYGIENKGDNSCKFENNYAVKCGPTGQSAYGQTNYFQPYFTRHFTTFEGTTVYYWSDGKFKDEYDTKLISTQGEDSDCQFTSSDISGGKVTYSLNNNDSEKQYPFVQKVDDDSLSLSNEPTLNLEFKANGPDFVVRYDKNGGDYVEGQTMHAQHFTKDKAQKLYKNVFTREGYDFKGWSRSVSGKIDFKDEQEVKDLGSDGDNIMLYAVWAKKLGPLQDENDNQNAEALTDSNTETTNITDANNANSDSDSTKEDTSTEEEKDKEGTVYKYRCQDADDEYYSNFTDKDSYLLKVTYNKDEVNVSTREMRVKKDGTSAPVLVTPKDGFTLASIDPNIEYSSDGGYSEQYKTHPVVSLTDGLGSVVIEHMNTNVEIVVTVKTIGELQPSGDGTEQSPYLVSNVNELIWIRNSINTGHAPDDIWVRQTRSIDLAGVSWKSIGDEKHPFCGHYTGKYVDGIGKTLSMSIFGLHGESLFGKVSGNTDISYIDYTGACGPGLVHETINKGDTNINIHHINVSGLINNQENSCFVGSVVDNVYGKTNISECNSYAALCLSFAMTYSIYDEGQHNGCGGLVGKITGNDCSVSNCSFYGRVTSDISYDAPGACANTVTLGGIVGFINPVVDNANYQISMCSNYGKIIPDGRENHGANAGGIAGAFSPMKLHSGPWNIKGDFTQNCKLVINNCQNLVDIESESSNIGGIVAVIIFGEENSSRVYHTADITLDSCLNSGEVGGTITGGGIVGNVEGDSRTQDTHSLNINTCSSRAGAVMGNARGEVVGDMYEVDNKTDNNYTLDLPSVNFAGVTTSCSLNNISGMSYEDYKSGKVVELLNKACGVTDIGSFGQYIDNRTHEQEEFPRLILTDEDKEKLVVNKVYHNNNVYYSNYQADQLAWFSLDSSNDDNVEMSANKEFTPVNGEIELTLNTKNGAFADKFEIYCDNQLVDTLTCQNISNLYKINYKATKAGEYKVVAKSKDIETPTPDKNENGEYVLKTSKDLIWAMQQVNVHHNLDLKFALGADIDMSGVDFVPIGTKDHEFSGTFTALKPGTNGTSESDFYCISSLNTSVSDNNGGLFGYVSDAAINGFMLNNVNCKGGALVYNAKNSDISTAIVKSGNVNVSKNDDYNVAAGVVGISDSSTIKQCMSNALCRADTEDVKNVTGGIAAVLQGPDNYVINCINTNDVYSLKKGNSISYSGGIVGLISASVNAQNCYSDTPYIYGCTNRGFVYGDDSIGGGIVGGTDANISKDCTNSDINWKIRIKNCTNEGVVGSIDSHLQIAGGVVGQIDGYVDQLNSSDANIKNIFSLQLESCGNYGLVAADSLGGNAYSGGVVGVANTYRNINVVNTYCYVTKVASEFSPNNAGLLVGKEAMEDNAIKCSNVYYNQYKELGVCGCASKDAVLGSYALATTEEFANGVVVDKLNQGSVKSSDINYLTLNYKQSNTDKPISLLNNNSIFALGQANYNGTFLAGSGSEADPYVIENPGQLTHLAISLQNGAYSDCEYKITSDLDMSSVVDFHPLGTSEHPFKGSVTAVSETENGNVAVRKIYNLDLGSEFNVSSIFGYTDGAKFSSIIFDNINCTEAVITSNIKNTTVASVKVVNSSVGGANSSSVGGIAGVAGNNVTINKCSVSLKSGVTCKNFGAVVGEVAGSNVDISMIEIDGDLVVDNSNESCHIGGVVGATTAGENISITNVDSKVNISTINSGEWTGIGGLVGGVWKNPKELNITGCSAFGVTGSSTSNGYAGGFIGKIISVEKDSVVNIRGCGNIGKTSSCKGAGGLIGQFDSNEVKLYIDTCFNADDVEALNDDSKVDTYAGGFIGRIDKVGPDKGHQAIAMDRVYSRAYSVKAKYAGKVCGMAPEKYNPTTSNILIDGIVAENSKGISGKNDLYVPSVSEHNEKDFESGEVCWQLNGQQDNPSGDYVYLQTIDKTDTYKDKDKYPKLENAEKVYNISKTYGQHVLSNYNHEVYHVKSADDLVKLVDIVDSGNVDLEVVLDNDIDMSGITWDKPIGCDSNKPFCGCFNGNGKTISNLNGLALFGYTSVDQLSSEYKNNSIIHNVKFENAQCKGAVLVQNAARTEIYDVETKGVVDPSIQLTPMQSTTENGTGAIVGSANKETKVHDCKNYCYVSGTTMYVGGVVGYMQGDKDRSTGYVYGSSIQNCQNYGDIVISVLTDPFSADFNSGSAFEDSDEVDTSEIDNIKQENQYEDYVQAKPELKPNEIIVAGGVLGSLGYYSSIDHCTNEGTVSSAYLGEKSTMLGAVLGQVYMYNMNAELNDCINTGNILGGTFAGGLVGNVCMAKVVINGCQSQTNCLGSCEYGSAGIGAIWLNANVDINNSSVTCMKNDSATPTVLCSYVESNLDIGDEVNLNKTLFDMYKTVGQGRVNGDYITVDTPSDQTNVQPANNTAVKVNVTALNNGSASINGVTASDDGNVAVDVNANSKVVITLQADQGYMTDVVKFGGKQVDLNGKDTYELEVGSDNIDVYVSFKESTEIVSNPTKEDPAAYKLVRENKVFTKWTSDKELPTESGNYYLTKDVVLSTVWNVPAGANISLSLDGHSITQGGNNMNVIEVNNGANLEVYDLRTNGRCFYFEELKDASGKQVGPWKLLGDNATYKAPADFPEDYRCDGGIITGSTGDRGCGIEVAHGGSAVMHQGNIVGNIGNISAGGVNNHGTFVNKHAYIVGNYGKYVGGIVNHTDGSFTLNYVVAHNVAEQSVGGIRNVGAMYVEGLTQVSGNILNCSDSTHSDVYNPAYSDLSLSTIDVLNNNKDDSGDIVTQSCRLTYTGVTVNPFNISYTIGNIASLGPLNWILTTNFSKHTIHPQNIVVKLKVNNPQYRVDIVNGELKVLKK